MSDENRDIHEELRLLRQQVDELREERRKRTARGPALLLAAVTAMTIGAAWAANGNCPNGLPFCFAANSPALATDVNTNFAFLREWIETKSGPLDAGFTTSSGILLNSGIITGATGNFHINTLPNAGGKLYLNWHSGNGGVIFGNGAQGQSAAINASGDLSITTVNGKRPQRSLATNCNSANCSVSCDPGYTIREAWGFHGNTWNANVGGPWQCGSAVQWMGACIGLSSCTVVTSCGSSSIWIDCW